VILRKEEAYHARFAAGVADARGVIAELGAPRHAILDLAIIEYEVVPPEEVVHQQLHQPHVIVLLEQFEENL
jgi:hypothetical protein